MSNEMDEIEKMAAAKIQSGRDSAQKLKMGLIQLCGVNIDSIPALAAEFNNILNCFDSPESSRRSKPPGSMMKKDEITRVVHTQTPISNDGSWNKYGSKFIKGSPFKRDYYRCRYENCKAKRQVQQVQKDKNSPLQFETTYFFIHTCQAANDDTYACGSTSMIRFDTDQVPTVTDPNLPPLISNNHQEPIIHAYVPVPVPVRNDGDETWMNSTGPVVDMHDVIRSSLNDPTFPVNTRNDFQETSWLNTTVPAGYINNSSFSVYARNDIDLHGTSWLNSTGPATDINAPTFSIKALNSFHETSSANYMNDDDEDQFLSKLQGFLYPDVNSLPSVYFEKDFIGNF